MGFNSGWARIARRRRSRNAWNRGCASATEAPSDEIESSDQQPQGAYRARRRVPETVCGWGDGGTSQAWRTRNGRTRPDLDRGMSRTDRRDVPRGTGHASASLGANGGTRIMKLLPIDSV